MMQSLAALYLSGRTVAWRGLHASPEPPVDLPAYPWQRQRFWLGAGDDDVPSAPPRRDPRMAGAHPLLGRRVPLAGAPRTLVWEAELDPRTEPFLRDHRVNGEIVLPGSGFLEMALAAAAAAGCGGTHALGDVVFSRGLVLQTGAPRLLQSVLTIGEAPPSPSRSTARPRAPPPPEWTLHVTAALVPLAAGADPAADIPLAVADIQGRCQQEVQSADLYRALSLRGLDYGPALQGIEQVWRGNGEAIGRVALPGALRAEAARYRVHPALLDAALQVIAAVPDLSADDRGITFLPAGCRRFRLPARPGERVWSHAVLRQGGDTSGGIVVDVFLRDDDGRLIGELLELRLARVRRSPRHDTAPADPDTWLYRLRWQEIPWPAAASPVTANRWVILADARGVADQVARLLVAQGQECRLIGPDAAIAAARGAVERGTPPDGPLETLLAEAFAGEPGPLRGLVNLWGCDPETQSLGCNAVLALVRRLVAACGTIGAPRLWLVTRGAQPVVAEDRLAVAQAPIWGLGKSVAFELPQFQCTLVDLDPGAYATETAGFLAKELLLADAEDQVALRGGRRMVARLFPHHPSPVGPTCPARQFGGFDEHGTYLITGGLGGLGLTVAQWMVERGVRHLALVGRRPPSPAASRVLDALRAAGATVESIAADVARMDEVTAVLERIHGTMPPLRGILHAAGVLENSPVVGLDAARLARVMAPKADGAWNLHLATALDDLHCFVLFSSAVSVLGSPGQGNYAAANSYLDVLAHLRHAAGQPALSINWGPWADVGLVADGNFIGSRPGRSDRGVKGITPARGLEVLANALVAGEVQLTALPFDLKSLLDLYPQAARIPLFAEVGGRESHVARLYARPTLRQEFLAPRNDIEKRLAEMWRQTLRIDRVGVRDSFFELGGDSVLAAQLVASAHRAFGVELDLHEAFKSFTIEAFATRVEAALLARLDSLSESEAERLLVEQ